MSDVENPVKITESATQIYSNGQAAVKLYIPNKSVYCVFAGAYIMHEPDGLDTRQLSATPPISLRTAPPFVIANFSHHLSLRGRAHARPRQSTSPTTRHCTPPPCHCELRPHPFVIASEAWQSSNYMHAHSRDLPMFP